MVYAFPVSIPRTPLVLVSALCYTSELQLIVNKYDNGNNIPYQNGIYCRHFHSLSTPMNQPQTILLVDDEAAIRVNLGSFLERAGFRVIAAADGQEALELLAINTPDLIVTDVMMPRLNGRDLLRHIRKTSDGLPIILLTQVGESTERAMALEEGADDYLNKPFDPHELVARIRAVLRRVRPGQLPIATAQILMCHELRFDRTASRVWLNGKPLVLTPKATTLLEYMLTHADELLTRERLLDVVWGWDYPAGTRTVDTRIAEIRKALSDYPATPRYIETVSGQGYRWVGVVEGK